MAACTLDDLVPSVRCNRVFLEPIGQTYTNYKVKFDLSVYDVVDDEDGIANYLMTDTFKQYFLFKVFYCRSNSCRLLADYLSSLWNETTETGISESRQACVFAALLNLVLQRDRTKPDDEFIEDNKSELRNIYNFSNRQLEKLQSMCSEHLLDAAADIEYELIYGEDIVPNLKRYTNEKGQIEYDVKLPMDRFTFTNNVDVEDCYLYVVPYFDISHLYSMTTGTQTAIDVYSYIDYYYNKMHSCIVLENKLPGTKVQDFRRVERIAEIIQSHRITDVDHMIDDIATQTGDATPYESGITSDVLVSYKHFHGTTGPIAAEGVFFINIYNLLKRKAKYPFLYDNLYDNDMESAAELMATPAVLTSLELYRTRKGYPDTKTLISTNNSFTREGAIWNHPGIYVSSFQDYDFRKISYGEYYYEVKIMGKDPMEDFVEALVFSGEQVLDMLSLMISYIHNNAGEYDELRDELSSTAQGAMSNITLVPDALSHFTNTMVLLKLFTGINHTDYPSIFEFDSKDRRGIENLHRVISDLLFEVGKYYEAKNISIASQTSIKASSIFEYERSWIHNCIDASKSYENMIDVIENSLYGGSSMFSSHYSNRTLAEVHKFLQPSNYPEDSTIGIGYLTPEKINDLQIHDLNDTSAEAAVLAEFFVNLLEQPSYSKIERNIMELKLMQTDDYTQSIRDMKNNPGMFETFMNGQGVTIKNKTANSLNTDIPFPGKGKTATGIDIGLNNSGNNNSSLLTEEQIEEVESERQAAKQQLMDEFLKKEDMVSRILAMDEAYSIMDRKEFTQGLPQNERFNDISAVPYSEESSRRTMPVFFDLGGAGVATNAGTKMMHMRAFNRFVLDNIFMVYILAGYSFNTMKPVWRHLAGNELIEALIQNVTPGTRFLCKLKRFKSSTLNVGQGAMSDRQVLSQYFFLKI